MSDSELEEIELAQLVPVVMFSSRTSDKERRQKPGSLANHPAKVRCADCVKCCSASRLPLENLRNCHAPSASALELLNLCFPS